MAAGAMVKRILEVTNNKVVDTDLRLWPVVTFETVAYVSAADTMLLKDFVGLDTLS